MKIRNFRQAVLILSFSILIITLETSSVLAKNQLYTVQVIGPHRLEITDSHGNTNKPLSPVIDHPVPGVNYEPGSSPGSRFISPHTVTFLDNLVVDIRFRTTSDPASSITITKGAGTGPGSYTSMLIRYLDFADLGIPSNVTAWIRLTKRGVTDLKLDRDGDSSFETTIKPQFMVTGRAAKDTVNPFVKITTETEGTFAIVTMTATDTGSGVKNIQYQIGDGNPNHYVYTAPFRVEISKAVSVFAIATDMAGNRSIAVKSFGPDSPAKPVSDPYKLRSIPF